MSDTDPKSHSSSPPPPPSSSSSSGLPSEIRTGHSNNHGSNQFSGHKAHYVNPPDALGLPSLPLDGSSKAGIPYPLSAGRNLHRHLHLIRRNLASNGKRCHLTQQLLLVVSALKAYLRHNAI
ncbi:hypothetical protein K1719_026079 [Acacia pycnantha]|nr:hypothetical protein K1719_026079 [Acacia pycnantha]